jgi:hypothetical protein
MMLSIERSAERRAPIESITRINTAGVIPDPSSGELKYQVDLTEDQIDQDMFFTFIIRSDSESYAVSINTMFTDWAGLDVTSGGDVVYGTHKAEDFIRIWNTTGKAQDVFLRAPLSGVSDGNRMINMDSFGDYLSEGAYVSPTVGYKAKDRIRTCTVFDTTLILNTQRNVDWWDGTKGPVAVNAPTVYYGTYAGPTTVPVKNDIRLSGTGVEEGFSRENFLLLPVVVAADLIAFNDATNSLPGPQLKYWDYSTGVYPGGLAANAGLGRIYYCRKGIGIYPPGFYRAISTEAPYYQHIRDEGENCVFDPTSLPFRISNVATDKWTVDFIPWEPRKSGTADTNPGPKAFETPSEVSDLRFFRDRLWMASGSRVFSSALSDVYDFFLKDPTQVLDTDPIDLMATSGSSTVSRITHLRETVESMLVITDGDVQYEILGSSNIISPATVSLSPSTTFTTNRYTQPIRIGRALYYFSQDKLFLYYSNPQVLTTMVDEMSRHVPNYLPYRHRKSTAAAGYNTLFTVDDNDSFDIYLYYSLQKDNDFITQSFHKWNVPGDVRTIEVISDTEDNTYLYMISVYSGTEVHMEKINLDPRKTTKPFVDCLRTTNTEVCKMVYDAGDDVTKITCYGGRLDWDIVMKSDDGWTAEEAGEEIPIRTASQVSGNWEIQLYGDMTAGELWVGKKYTSLITTKEPTLRDKDNNYIYAMTNCRRFRLVYDNSGPFTLSYQNHLTPATGWTFNSGVSYTTLSQYLQEDVSTQSEWKLNILKPIANLRITLSTDRPTPLNLLSAVYECTVGRQANPRAV